MNYRQLTDLESADFAKNVKLQLEGVTLKAIDTNVRTELATSFGVLPATLATQAAAVVAAAAERKATVSSRNSTRAQMLALVSQVRNALRAGLATKEQ